MKHKTFDITFEQAKVVLDLRDEIAEVEQHTVYCKDDFGRFRLSFTANEDLTQITMEQPRLVFFFKSDDGDDVYLETHGACSFERGWAALQKFFLNYDKFSAQ